LEETLLKKGFFQAIFRKLLKVFGNREPLWRGFKGKALFQKGFPLNLMTLPTGERGTGSSCGRGAGLYEDEPDMVPEDEPDWMPEC
jgi:hypothetical protein